MADKRAIKVNKVTKTFRLPHEKNTSVKSAFLNFYKRKRTFEKQQVLQDISFEIYEGEFFGIVGRNGSGKSTLLKLLAGIYTPSSGSIDLSGKLTPFIELGVGFNPDLSGRENVYLNGALLGFNRKEMSKMYDEIVDFAELSRFMDQKLKNYSSGMQVRLAFSIAIKSTSNILLFDEVLAVGDTEFQTKCFQYFRKVKEETNRTIILVSHDMAAIQKFCDRAALINGGKLEMLGSPSEVAALYQKLNFPEASQNLNDGENSKFNIAILDPVTKKPKSHFSYKQEALIKISWHDKKVKNIGVAIFNDENQYIFGANTVRDNEDVTGTSIFYKVVLNLGHGSYHIKAALFGETEENTIYFNDIGPSFYISADKKWEGLTYLDHSWENVT